MTFDMATTLGLAKWWWTFIVRGVVAILFGILAFLSPAFGLAVLVGLFAAWAIIDGVNSLLTGIRTRGQDRSWWLEILEGVIGVAAGIFALVLPAGFVAEVLLLVIAAWAILTGIL